MIRITAILAAFILCMTGLARAETWPPPAADLAVSLLPASGDCAVGEECRFVVHLANEGSAQFDGRVDLSHHSTVPGVPVSEMTCTRHGFNSFDCGTSLKLAPHGATTVALAVRMLATPRSEAEHCVSLKGLADPVSANDQSCATVRLGTIAEQSECGAGQNQINDRCIELATFCTGGRSFDAASGGCACPADRPMFDRASGACAVSLAAFECSGGRTSFNGGCYCPQDKPFWDRAASTCRSEAKPVAVAVAAPVIAKPKVKIAAAPKQAAAHLSRVKRPVRASVAKRPVQVQRSRPKPVRVAAAPPPKCPPLWKLTRGGYCWPGFWIDPYVFSLPR